MICRDRDGQERCEVSFDPVSRHLDALFSCVSSVLTRANAMQLHVDALKYF